MKNIRIEEVGDINSDYPYLEVFLKEGKNPFLEIAISDDKELVMNFYPTSAAFQIEIEDLEFILMSAKEFLPKALKNEDDFLDFTSQ